MNAESLVLGEPRDALVNPDKHHNSIHFYRGAPSPAMLVHFDGGHIAPLPMKVLGLQLTGNPEIIRVSMQVEMALLLTRFKGMYGNDLDR